MNAIANPAPTHPRPAHRWAPVSLAVALLLFGIPIFAGGVWLIVLGGSWYYAPAGLGLIATATLLFQRDMAAVWIYLATYVGTVLWAVWEAGFDGWAQVPRLVAPTVVLVLVLLTIPVLRRRPAARPWRQTGEAP